jgi:hypothetical protein
MTTTERPDSGQRAKADGSRHCGHWSVLEGIADSHHQVPAHALGS